MIYFPMSYALIYFAVVSAVAVALTLLDRHRAKTDGLRIAEIWLLVLAACGGAAAMLITMCATRHKIYYMKFKIGLPVLILLHGAFLALVAQYGPTYTFTINVQLYTLVAVLAVINMLAAAITNLDKKNAQKDMWRIPEDWLMLIALVGGAFGMLLTMCVIRHKTRYAKFMVGLPMILLLQVLLLIYLFSEWCQFVVFWTP